MCFAVPPYVCSPHAQLLSCAYFCSFRWRAQLTRKTHSLRFDEKNCNLGGSSLAKSGSKQNELFVRKRFTNKRMKSTRAYWKRMADCMGGTNKLMKLKMASRESREKRRVIHLIHRQFISSESALQPALLKGHRTWERVRLAIRPVRHWVTHARRRTARKPPTGNAPSRAVYFCRVHTDEIKSKQPSRMKPHGSKWNETFPHTFSRRKLCLKEMTDKLITNIGCFCVWFFWTRNSRMVPHRRIKQFNNVLCWHFCLLLRVIRRVHIANCTFTSL